MKSIVPSNESNQTMSPAKFEMNIIKNKQN